MPTNATRTGAIHIFSSKNDYDEAIRDLFLED